MKIADNVYAFIWESMTANNCNTYLIDGPTRILIDPGHIDLFDHVRSGLEELKITLDDVGLIICTHGHPDHIESVQQPGSNHTRYPAQRRRHVHSPSQSAGDSHPRTLAGIYLSFLAGSRDPFYR